MRLLITTEEDRTQAKEHLDRIKLNGSRRYVYDCKMYRRPRTSQQNNTLWMWYSVIADETGTNAQAFWAPPEVIHEECKGLFFKPVTFFTHDGRQEHRPGSTKALNTLEFTEYMEKVRVWAEDMFGVVLPDPSMKGYDQMVAHYNGGG